MIASTIQCNCKNLIIEINSATYLWKNIHDNCNKHLKYYINSRIRTTNWNNLNIFYKSNLQEQYALL